MRRGDLGYVQIAPLTPQLAEQLGVQGTQGFVVTRLGRASSAFRAGMRPGDVIRTFNDVTVTDPGQLYKLISDSAIGSTAAVGIVREGKAQTLRIPVERPRRGQ